MELLEYGKIVKIHGLSGEIKIFPYSSSFDNLDNIEHFYIKMGRSRIPEKYFVERKRIQKNSLIVKLENIDNHEMANSLVGKPVMVDISNLVEPGEDEYYWYQLKGIEVKTHDGKSVGIVENLMQSGAHDILIIKNGKKEYLIPLTDMFVEKVDLENNLILINPENGLID